MEARCSCNSAVVKNRDQRKWHSWHIVGDGERQHRSLHNEQSAMKVGVVGAALGLASNFWETTDVRRVVAI
jgi:hypothetical protein